MEDFALFSEMKMLTLPRILFLAFLVRILWVLYFPSEPISDFKYYDDAAYVMRVTGHYFSEDGIPTSYWPVGYVAFLSLLYRITVHSWFIGWLANILLALASIWLLYAITNRFFGKSAARIAALIYTFWPNGIAYCGLLSSECLFTFGLLLVLWLGSYHDFVRTGVIGISMGLLALVRPIAVFLPVIFAPFEREHKEPLRFGFIRFIPIVFVMGLVLLPWEMRNHKLWHHIVPVSTNGGINLYIGNNPQANGGYLIPESDPIWQKLMSESNEAETRYPSYPCCVRVDKH